MRNSVWNLLLALAALNHQEVTVAQPEQTQSEVAGRAARDASLEWTMRLEGARLRLEYSVKNLSKTRLYVAESVLVARKNAFERAPDAVITVNGAAPGTVEFVRGVRSPAVPVAVLREPTFRALEPGETMRGAATVGVPIKAWHNVARVEPITGTPSRAVLEVQYFVGEPPAWTDLPGTDGKPIRVPRGQESRRLRTEPTPIPTK